MPKAKPSTVSEYIAAAPKKAQPKLRELRTLLRRAAPKAREGLKWGSPAYEDRRILFAFAAFQSHINFMPTPSAMKPFKKHLAKYKTGKGTIQFPYDRPLPKALIRRIAAYRVKELRDDDVRWM
jgi:uncharacterized protein YdhG (YjbR/CyaY superfamily)